MLLVGCNRTATEGILPDDLNEEEVVSNETNDLNEDTSESDLGMQALLDEEIEAITTTEEQVDDAVDTTEQSNLDIETTSETTLEETTTEVEETTSEMAETTSNNIENMPASTASTYTVQSGDWVYKIARLHNITPIALLSANPVIGTDQQVYPGQELIIPVQGTAADIQVEEQPVESNTVENNDSEIGRAHV